MTYVPRVLLIDSDPDLLTLLRTYLEEQQLSVDCAMNPHEAAILLAARPYEMILVGRTEQRAELTRLAAAHRPLIVSMSERDRTSDCFIERRDVVRHMRPFVESARELRHRSA